METLTAESPRWEELIEKMAVPAVPLTTPIAMPKPLSSFSGTCRFQFAALA